MNIRSVNFHNIVIGIDFLEMIPKHKQNRGKKKKLWFIKIKNFDASEDTIKKVKIQPTVRETICKPCILSGTCIQYVKNTINLVMKRKKDTIKKCWKGLNKHFSREDIQVINKHTKRCLTTLVIRKFKSKQDFALHPLWHLIKKSGHDRCWRRCREIGSLILLVGT